MLETRHDNQIYNQSYNQGWKDGYDVGYKAAWKEALQEYATLKKAAEEGTILIAEEEKFDETLIPF